MQDPRREIAKGKPNRKKAPPKMLKTLPIVDSIRQMLNEQFTELKAEMHRISREFGSEIFQIKELTGFRIASA